MMMAMYIPLNGGTIDPVPFTIIMGLMVLSVSAWIYMCMKAEVTR
jgi:hypothetical protein